MIVTDVQTLICIIVLLVFSQRGGGDWAEKVIFSNAKNEWTENGKSLITKNILCHNRVAIKLKLQYNYQ